MRLAPILSALSDAELERLAVEHVPTDERPSRLQLCNLLEGALRGFRFINEFVLNRQPPTFSILTLLLEAEGYELPKEGFRNLVMEETDRIKASIDAGELLARDDQLGLYRSALYEARRNDLDINTSESAILSVLRRRLEIQQVEHFLIEHHADFREFWAKDDCYAHEETALRSVGLIFEINGKVVIPEELAPAIWQTLGLDMPKDGARRLYGFLNSAEIGAILDKAGCKTSGSKEEKIERLVFERIQPRLGLPLLSLATLKDICRETDAAATGNKDDVIERIVSHFAEGRDQAEPVSEEPPQQEPRRLTAEQFETMFGAMVHLELSDILRRFPVLRQTGTKEIKIRTLWSSHLSEQSLLSELTNRQLEDFLHSIGLKLSGSKVERIERLLAHFGAVVEVAPIALRPDLSMAESKVMEAMEVPPDIAKNQELFRQKSANPSSSLQPWLEEMLDGKGLIRCYATEDENPTKQLKNKLSQAAAAKDGLLVLLLNDKSAFLKAREALAERWMANAEWPKSVACVALAFPLASPEISALVERTRSVWLVRVRERLFPNSEVVRLNLDAFSSCPKCNAELPGEARFCPSCGASVRSDGAG